MSRGVGQKSGRPLALDPRPPHVESFFLPEPILEPSTLSMSNAQHKKASENKDVISDSHGECGKSGDILAFLSQPDLPGLPPSTRTCLRCGKPVPAPKRAGRPRRFCSEQCRRDQAAEQRSRWTASHADAASPDALTCWSCGEAFPAPSCRRGRLPRFCGPDCRRAARRALNAGYRLRKAHPAGNSHGENHHGPK